MRLSADSLSQAQEPGAFGEGLAVEGREAGRCLFFGGEGGRIGDSQLVGITNFYEPKAWSVSSAGGRRSRLRASHLAISPRSCCGVDDNGRSSPDGQAACFRALERADGRGRVVVEQLAG